MKRFILTSMMALICFSMFAFHIPERPNPPKLVNDYIGLLQPDQIQALEKKLVDFNDKTSIQIAVVILDDLGGEDAKTVVDELGEKWGVGQKGLNNGIVFMIVKYGEKAMDEMIEQKHGDWQIAVGDGLGEYLTDNEAFRIGNDVFIPHAKKDEYYAGIDETITTMLQKLGPIGWEQRQEFIKKKEAERAEAARNFLQGLLYTVIALAIIVLVALLIVIIRREHRKAHELRERRASLKKKFDEDLQTYETLLNQLPSLKDDYPDWAKAKQEKLFQEIRMLKLSCKEAIQKFPDAITNNLVLASGYIGKLEDVIDDIQGFTEGFDAIGTEVKKYEYEAPAKLKTVKSTMQMLKEYILTTQKSGYKMVASMAKQESLQKEMDKLEQLANTGKAQSKELYDQSIEFKKALDVVTQEISMYLNAEDETKTLIAKTEKDIEALPAKKAEAQRILDQLKAECPEDNWSELSLGMSMVSGLLEQCTSLKRQAEQKNSFDIQDFTTAKSLAKQADQKMEVIYECFHNIHERSNEIHNTKANFPSLVKGAKTAIASAESKCNDSDVESGAKRKLSAAQSKLKEAETAASRSLVDWLICLALITAAKNMAVESYQMAQKDIDDAKAARKAAAAAAAAAALAAAEAAEDARIEREREANESKISYSPSLDNDSGGGFSGFGGGGFGGGGAGGSW